MYLNMNNISNKDGYGYVIQARLGSVRLPGKALLYFRGTTVIEYLINSLVMRGIQKNSICVTTSLSKLDDVLASYICELGVKVVRGEEENVLKRFQKVISETGFENIVRLTGDNPLIDIDLVSYCVSKHKQSRVALTTTREIKNERVTRYVPKGLSIDVINSDSLLSIDSAKCSTFEIEHVIPYFYENFPVLVIKDYIIHSDERSIDTIQDYVRVCQMSDCLP